MLSPGISREVPRIGGHIFVKVTFNHLTMV